ncbi:alcohol dehydrogenase catalytic domain-containing protein [Streptomyces sp. HNM0574]|uniref:alcohol dehydrogenase catalytic domain-containing protein n=1 Tax=Streptomyces sp. HNM0574 TaxID=2714954 RepID=UPI00146A4741|nr:alcohol dehydrogenase catalytic domain-containing protein [Streptomyces sp. HNM0574]NLU70906.1 alcohol dehydrogenase catalytic domain-containing protein [Streptomyces sp. HNM0574]
MRGVVLEGQRPEVVDDLRVRGPGAGEVLVGIRAAGLCHSDLSVADGTIPYPRPVVLGHEGAGVVEAVGEGVTHVAPGDHVALSTLANCGTCAQCDRGRPTMCRKAIGRPGTPFSRAGTGGKLYNFASNSAFAERTVVKAVQAVAIPEDIPFTSACLMGCGVVTGVGAVLNRARVAQGETVVVIGAGGVGLNVLQGARIAGAGTVVAVDANPAKEETARAFGATHFVDASATADAAATAAAVREILPDGADHAFECVGSTGLIRLAVDLLDRHGQAVLLGVPPAEAEASFQVSAMYLDKAILGCRYGSSRPQRDIALYADLYRDGRLLLDELVTRVYPVEDFAKAAEDAHRGRVARAVLTF